VYILATTPKVLVKKSKEQIFVVVLSVVFAVTVAVVVEQTDCNVKSNSTLVQ
jgi:hypothetical protein